MHFVFFAQAASGSGFFEQMGVPLLMMAPILYFLIIRPQQKEAKKTQEMMSSLKKGDDVVTSSGILGKVFAVTSNTVTVEVANGVKLRMLKSGIAQRGTVSDEPAKADSKSDSGKSDSGKSDAAKFEETKKFEEAKKEEK